MRGQKQPSPVPDTGTLNHQVDLALSPPLGLTEREKEVLKLFVEGLTYNQIARQLNISWSTVGSHLNTIYRKLGGTNPVQALRRVLEPSLHTEKESLAVQALTAAASVHDRETYTHAERLIHLSEATARQLNRPEAEIHLLRLAALLHDIGKIGIPEAILRKAGSLTQEEWALMRQHPELGCQILEQVGGVFGQLAHIVRTHHERWDGHGYPHGLAHEAIPMSARILTVADAYDAMISPRPYRREPLTISEATTQLQQAAGRQFDPHVVEAFLSVLAAQEHLPSPFAYGKAAGTREQPALPLQGPTGNVWQAGTEIRERLAETREHLAHQRERLAETHQHQLALQQRIEARQHQGYLAWRQQERERQRQEPFPLASSQP